MNFNSIGKCQCCGRVRVNHTPEEAHKCKKRQDREKNKRRSAYYLRLELAEQIIREQKRITRIQLAREIDKKIQTTPWTIDKMKKDILEESSDIRWDGHNSAYYVDTTLDNYIGKQERLEKSFSLYKSLEELR